jgi:predicted  nucleic acid-binding Zn-ribbon protein
MANPFRDEQEAALVLVERLKIEVTDLREQVAYLSDGRAENERAFVARLQERAQQAETENLALRAEAESLRNRNHKLERQVKGRGDLDARVSETTGSILEAVARWLRRE